MGRKKKNQANLTEETAKTEAKVSEQSASAQEIAKIQSEFFEIMNYQRKQRGNLLGSFENGEYKIQSEEILKGLVEIPKKYEVQEGNVIRLSVKLNEFVLNFRIDLDINESYCTAKLFLIETEQDAVENIKYVSEIDSRVEAYSPNFISDTLAFWHAYMNENPYEKNDILLNYLAMQKEEYLFNLELSAILSQLYLVRMTNLLDGLGTLGEKVRYEYKILMEKLLLEDPGLSQDFVMQKVYLDQILAKNKAFEEIAKLPEGAKALRGYSTPLKNVRDKTYPSIMTEAPKKAQEEKKEEKKAASKPASKSKSGGGGKSLGGGSKVPKIDFLKALKNSSLPVHFGRAPASIVVQRDPAPQQAPGTMTIEVPTQPAPDNPGAEHKDNVMPESPVALDESKEDMGKPIDSIDEQNQKKTDENEIPFDFDEQSKKKPDENEKPFEIVENDRGPKPFDYANKQM